MEKFGENKIEERSDKIDSPEEKVAILPFIEVKESLFDRDDYFHLSEEEKQIGVVYRFTIRNIAGEFTMYTFREVVDGLHYVLKSFKGIQTTLSFETEEYGLAITGLSTEGQIKLANSVASFLETVYQESGGAWNEFAVAPSSAAYEREDVDGCRKEIIDNFPEYAGDIVSSKKYEGVRLFELYKELFKKEYLGVHPNQLFKHAERARVFRIGILRHLKNWKAVKNIYLGEDFSIVRKQEQNI